MFIAPQDETPLPFHSQANLMRNTAGLFKFRRPPSYVRTSKRKHVLLFSRIRVFSWHWRVAVAPISQRHTRIRSNNGHSGKWRRSVGKILDRGIGFPLYF